MVVIVVKLVLNIYDTIYFYLIVSIQSTCKLNSIHLKNNTFFVCQLETIKSGSPIAKATSQSEENLLQANLYKEGKCY